ncbi:hypothetical protein BU23DRAFT_75619 [Bimuria novae-zelandiae CBS 107.79]|uniref:Uncharacterized protein n=1 Tax=Bimuria novae-zelandiae CBS 107.79 TaxID=1447943 RepID=A0A6A5VEA9_9PLEO|nr:hypothetical protein BU23DRAFT_75619 [Bimuria novae-zelandiae CBS 107.79]
MVQGLGNDRATIGDDIYVRIWKRFMLPVRASDLSCGTIHKFCIVICLHCVATCLIFSFHPVVFKVPNRGTGLHICRGNLTGKFRLFIGCLRRAFRFVGAENLTLNPSLTFEPSRHSYILM